jgi:hypothetical protein
MAEIKNTFLKSKMNKDLDARLLPNGEYRDAQNINISRSEGPDVGAIENVLGNILRGTSTSLIDIIATVEAQKLTDKYGTTIRVAEIKCPQLEIIGYYMDIFNDKIYLFLTDYVDSSNDQLSNFAPANYIDTSSGFPGNFIYKGAGCYIVEYVLRTNTYKILISGNFLNFSKTHPILNVNLLEDLLFWTDNRNQPRKINIQRASNDSWEFSGPNDPYYYNEDHISVAKFAPYDAFTFIDNSNVSTLISNKEQYLPAHIVTQGSYVSGTGEITLSTSTYTAAGSNPDLKIGDLVTIGDDPSTAYVSTAVSTTTITIQSGLGALGTIQIAIQRPNPLYDAAYTGDTSLLQNDFARFSYRFKYDDGEYSLIAPFTQAAFVPKQFGYFVSENEQTTLESGTVKFMENRVDQVKLNLTLPEAGNTIVDKLKIQEVQILVKNSDETAVRVIEDVPASVLTALGATTTYQYNYISSKPIKTLPEADLIRVYDKAPIRSMTQEIVGNRVIYGNFLDKHASPDYADFDLTYNAKDGSDSSLINFATEFPNHTVKQNRSYQVGLVLIDRYGRASNVLLNDPTTVTASNKNSTIYAPYNNASSDSVDFTGDYLSFNLNEQIPGSLSKPGYPGLYSDTNPLGYYSYRIVVKQQEQEYYNVYTPGALAGEIYWDTLGYTEDNTTYGVANGPGNSEFLPSFISTNKLSTLTLSGDNINKVPRELNTISGNQDTFGSEILLFNRVNPIYNSTSSLSYSTQSSIGRQGAKVVSIKPFTDLGTWTTTKGQLYPGGINDAADSTTQNPIPFYPYFVSGSAAADYQFNFHDILFDAQANPFVAVIETVDFKIGATPEYTNKSTIERAWQNLGVFETKPTISNLDIFWESSSCGLISDLNTDVSVDTPVGVDDTANNNTALGDSLRYIHTEATAVGADVTLLFDLVNASGTNIAVANATVTIDSVLDGTGADRTSEFSLFTDTTTTPDSYKIQTANTMRTGVGALTSSITTNQVDFVNGTYTGIVGVTSGYTTNSTNGAGLELAITVAGNTVTTVTVEKAGTGFITGNTITVTGSGGVLGGGTGNLVITLVAADFNTYGFVYNSNANVKENYTFNLLATDPAGTFTNAPIAITNCQLQNVVPAISSQPSTLIKNINKGDDLFTYTSSSFSNGSINTDRDEEQLQVIVVDATTENIVSEITAVPSLGSNEDRVIRSTVNAVDGTYKLKITDANGTGLSVLSNSFEVIFNT